jgi:hypothetical protein
MSELTEIVDVTITQDTVGETQPGFGTPLILSHNATFPERVKYYGSTTEAAVDWPVTSPEYLGIKAALSQSPHVELVAVGRSVVKPTQQYSILATTVRNSDQRSYRANVLGQGVTATTAAYTTDSTASLAKIHNGLLTSLNAVVGRNYLATFTPLTYTGHIYTADNTTEIFTITGHGLLTGDGPFQVTTTSAQPAGLSLATDYWVIVIDANTFKLAISLANAFAGTNLLISTNGTGTQTLSGTVATVSATSPLLVTGSAPGNWFSLEVTDVSALSIKQTHADPGITAELDSIAIEDNTWYALLTNYNSAAYTEAASAWIQAQTKVYIFDDLDTGTITNAVSIGTDAGVTLKGLAPRRTAGAYYSSPGLMFSAAWAGRVLNIEPGSENWMFKVLSGVAPNKLTSTQRKNLRDRSMSWYQTAGGRNITWQGSTFDGNFLDIIRGLDWSVDDMTKAIFTTMASNDKLSMDDPGITTIENDIIASIDRAVQRKIYRAFPRPIVIAPKVANISDSDKALRTATGFKFSAQLAGAINKTIVNGTVSV